jgi:hypothetical protein
MWPPTIIEVQVTANRSAGLGYTVVGSQIHLLVFDAAPQALDEDVISPSPFAVHADGNAVVGEHAGEGRPRELRTLIRVEDIRLAVASESVLQCLDAEHHLLSGGSPTHGGGGISRRHQGRDNCLTPLRNSTLTIAHITPLVALLAGILILIVPRLLSFIVAIYLIIVGLIGLNAIHHFIR